MEQKPNETNPQDVASTPNTVPAHESLVSTTPNTKLEGSGIANNLSSEDAFDVLTPEPAPVVTPVLEKKNNLLVVGGVVLLVAVVLVLMYVWGSRFAQAPVVENTAVLNVTERPQVPEASQEKSSSTTATVYENPNTPTPEALSALSADLQKDPLAGVDTELQNVQKEVSTSTAGTL